MKATIIALSLTSGAFAGYAPYYTACPGNSSLLRFSGTQAAGNQTVNPDETTYVNGRRAQVPGSLKTYLGSLAGAVYGGTLDSSASSTPAIALAVSGGGDRAALYGAGVLAALDGRNSSAVAAGTGGLLQSASYISALSGGSWMLSSLIFNNFPTMYDMVLGNPATNQTGWNLVYDLFTPGNDTALQATYRSQLFADVVAKKNAGDWNVTFNDYWARALSRHYLPGTTLVNFFDNVTSDHGASLRYSSATSLSSYTSQSLPFPIIVAEVYSPSNPAAPLTGEAVPVSNIVYEMTPLEFGSYDPSLAAFIGMGNLGTALNAGKPVGGSAAGQCVANFDNAGFILGTSSNLFNLYNISSAAAWTSNMSAINVATTLINSTFTNQPNQQLDITALPNPFKGLGNPAFFDSAQDQLRLLDGGLDGQVDPIAPLTVPGRRIDVLVVIDGTSDNLFHRPEGASMVATNERTATLPGGAVSLPPLPKTTDTYIAQGLNLRPTFFGCGGTPAKLSGAPAPATYPMLVFLPNYETTGVTNTSTSQLVYSPAAAQKFMDTSFSIATRGIPTANGTADPLWPTCLACTVVERVRGRNGVDMTPACGACFSRYCWSGVESAVVVKNATTTASASATAAGTMTASASVGSPTVAAKAGAEKLGAGVLASILGFAIALIL